MAKKLGLLGVVLSLGLMIFAIRVDAATREVGPSGYPYTSIQAAINSSSPGDTVLVHDGTYTENINFSGRVITVRSENGPISTTIDGSAGGRVVTFNSGEGSGSVLDGFTITHGSGINGGGIFCDISSPVISNCTITDNTAVDYGGGIYCAARIEYIVDEETGETIARNVYPANPTITNCTISNNTATAGGGIYTYESSPTIIDSTISNNTTGAGGGIYCAWFSSPNITNCTISGNTATESSGDGGGGIYCASDSSITVTGGSISNNSAFNGGGIFFQSQDGTITISGCTITGNSAENGGGAFFITGSAIVTGCTISGNTATSGAGAGIYNGDSFLKINNSTITGNQGDGINLGSIQSSALITYCTIADNSGAGLKLYRGASPYVASSILRNNGSQVNISAEFAEFTNPKFSYCNIQGGYPGLGNIDSDPLFVNPGAGDYSLQAGSPSIDSGHPRISDSDTSRSDMGAYGREGGADNNTIIITVDAGGSGDYTSIQDAIDYAVSGDTITVLPGIYNETLVMGGERGLSCRS